MRCEMKTNLEWNAFKNIYFLFTIHNSVYELNNTRIEKREKKIFLSFDSQDIYVKTIFTLSSVARDVSPSKPMTLKLSIKTCFLHCLTQFCQRIWKNLWLRILFTEFTVYSTEWIETNREEVKRKESKNEFLSSILESHKNWINFRRPLNRIINSIFIFWCHFPKRVIHL